MNHQSNKQGDRTGTYERYGPNDYSKGERGEERKRKEKSVDKSKERQTDDYNTNIDCSVF